MRKIIKYKAANYPTNTLHQAHIWEAAERLHKKLSSKSMADLRLSRYAKNLLFIEYMSSLEEYIQQYVYILEVALSQVHVPLTEITFMDYGGGLGLLSMLAKETGIGTVVYNDINEQMNQDAHQLALYFGLSADHYITGDIDATISFCKSHSLSCDVVASYDVIEHVYDIEYFLAQLPQLSSDSLSIMMTSSANGRNPFISRELKKLHQVHEYEERISDWGSPNRSMNSFYQERIDIITKLDSSLNDDEKHKLALATRGKRSDDIAAIVSRYKKTQLIPASLNSSDTCDPYTGNWSEKILDHNQLINVLQGHGFKAHIIPGYFASPSFWSTVKNSVISSFPNVGLTVAPSFSLYAHL